MKITVNKEILMNKVLYPISRMTEQCIINIYPDYIETMATVTEGNPILHTKLYISSDIGDKKVISLNLPNITKLSRLLSCIISDEIELEIDSNSISYKSLDVTFKYHLLEDDIIPIVPGNPDNFNRIKFETDFILTKDKMYDITKGLSYSQESKKIYFYMKDKKVFAELSDKEIANTDSVSYFITDKFNGNEIKTPMVFDVELFKLLFPGIKEDVVIKATSNVLLFKLEENDFVLEYLLSAIVK